MDVFVIPVGPDRYELYCELAEDLDVADEPLPRGFIGRQRHRFKIMLRAAEARQRGADVDSPAPTTWPGRLQERVIAWVAERVAEQRLLWNLRRQTSATAIHPEDIASDQAVTLIRRILERDYERHKVWLVVDTVFLLASGILVPIPGPNLVAYYFAFRVVGHWLSMRGARQGRLHIAWGTRPCAPLSELRRAASLEPAERERRLQEIAARLRLQHLPTFFERVAITRA